jgi:hypothetical protein
MINSNESLLEDINKVKDILPKKSSRKSPLKGVLLKRGNNLDPKEQQKSLKEGKVAETKVVPSKRGGKNK